MATDFIIDTPHGPLRSRLYVADVPSRDTIVWAHGGGFAAGSLDMPEADTVARAFATRGVTALSVDYALAPVPYKTLFADWTPRDGVRYPVASEQLGLAFAWAREHAHEWGACADRVALGGASAGANLAAGAPVRMLAAGDPLPSHVALAYPTLHAVQPETPAELAAALKAAGLENQFSPEPVRVMYENYVGGAVDDIDAIAAPGTATADALAGYPPTTIVAAETDELRVSGEAFAATLVAAGADARALIEPGTQHGYLNEQTWSHVQERTMDAFLARLRR